MPETYINKETQYTHYNMPIIASHKTLHTPICIH